MFTGMVNAGYTIIRERSDGHGSYVVLGFNRDRTFHNYVVWRAEETHNHQPVFYAGDYITDMNTAHRHYATR